MIDLHSHILPGVDDGARDAAVAVDMARAYLADGVVAVVCTPHILPGVYQNRGDGIVSAVSDLRVVLQEHGVDLHLFAGADNHMVPDFAEGVRSGRLLSLAKSRYVLVEPPHTRAPPRFEQFVLGLLAEGLVPVVTHPERLSWVRTGYEGFQRLAAAGAWMQVTAGSLAGTFGKEARYWAERMLDDGLVHVLATDAHNLSQRPPDLARGRELAARRIGDGEAGHLVCTRPLGVLQNVDPSELPPPIGRVTANDDAVDDAGGLGDSDLFGRLRRLFG